MRFSASSGAASNRVHLGLALGIAVASVSLSAPLVHAASPAPALTVAALRIGAAAMVLSLLSGSRLRVWLTLSRRHKLAILLAGFLLASHFWLWISSLYFTSTAASVALVATQPVFAALLGRVFLGEGLRPREGLGILVAALGCALLAGGDFASRDALLGDGLAVAGAATAACYLIVGRQLRSSLPLMPYLAFVNATAAGLLMLAALGKGVPLVGFEPKVYVAIAACALVPSVIGHTLLNWSVRRVAAHLVALAILGEPIGASLIQWAAHGEQPPMHAVVGGSVILAGIAIGLTRWRLSS